MDPSPIWYRTTPLTLLLLPLSWIFCAAVALRRFAYSHGWLKTHRVPVPVIVVGNITVGGTGKTPLVIWLVEYLQRHGCRPGVISRGYGGKAQAWPHDVTPDSDPYEVGDEPVLIARRTRCPVVVGPKRVMAAQTLLAHYDCDVILSDDGLQHYALERDIEIAVIDGERRHGNRQCLPAGPLREPPQRLREVDIVVANGSGRPGEYVMNLTGDQCRNLLDERLQLPLSGFRDKSVHAVAGIGYPERFFNFLRKHELSITAHRFPDHHRYRAEELDFNDASPVLMTEKDAVKCRFIAAAHHWYIPVDAKIAEALGQRVLALLKKDVPVGGARALES